MNLKNNSNLEIIFNFFKNNLNKQQNEFFPHISLIYKKMAIEQKKEIIRHLKLKNYYSITKISIHQHSDNVSKWKIVENFDFNK